MVSNIDSSCARGEKNAVKGLELHAHFPHSSLARINHVVPSTHRAGQERVCLAGSQKYLVNSINDYRS